MQHERNVSGSGETAPGDANGATLGGPAEELERDATPVKANLCNLDAELAGGDDGGVEGRGGGGAGGDDDELGLAVGEVEGHLVLVVRRVEGRSDAAEGSALAGEKKRAYR